MMPSTEAIEEEAHENVTRVGLFKRNSINEEEQNQDRMYFKKNTNEYIYENIGGGGGSTKSAFNKQESL